MLELFVNYNCSGTRATGRVKLSVENWENKRVADLKHLLEEKLCAPVCDQILFYQGRTLGDDCRFLKDLYLRQEDEIEVRFPSDADTLQVEKNVNDLNRFALKICSNQETVLERSSDLPLDQDFQIDALENDYMLVINALDALSVNLFSPWKRPKTSANRHYFVQVGGFNIFLGIFRFSFRKYQVKEENRSETIKEVQERSVLIALFRNEPTVSPGENQQLTSKQWLGTDPEVPSVEIASNRNSVQLLNVMQYKLLVWCLYFLWNFSETVDELKLMIKSDVLPLATHAFLLDPQSACDDSALNSEWKNLLVEINFHALGCVTGCTEIDANAQISVVSNTDVINKMVSMMDQHLPETQEMYSLFCSQCASHGLFYCTWSSHTHRMFIEKGLHHEIIEITKHCMNDSAGDIVIRYFGCLVLAVLSSSCTVMLESNVTETINVLIEEFLLQHEPCEASAWEEEHGYVWVTLVPLVHLLFAGGPPVTGEHAHVSGVHTTKDPFVSNAKLGGTTAEWKSSVSTQINYASEMLGSCQIEPVDPIQTEKQVVMKKHSFTQDWKDKCMQKSRLGLSIKSDYKAQGSCSFQRPIWPGSFSTQKLGLFALKYLLCIDENRGLIESEGLLNYLLCLSWSLNMEQYSQLVEQLRKFDHIPPPSLKTISKSLLARMYGLQTVLKL